MIAVANAALKGVLLYFSNCMTFIESTGKQDCKFALCDTHVCQYQRYLNGTKARWTISTVFYNCCLVPARLVSAIQDVFFCERVTDACIELL